MRVAREQLQNVSVKRATWTHPDGATWKTIDTVVIPAMDGAVRVHARVMVRKVGTQLGMVRTAQAVLTVATDIGGTTWQFVNAAGVTDMPGACLSHESSLDKCTAKFAPTVVGSDVHVAVLVQWPNMAGGDQLNVKSETWWE